VYAGVVQAQPSTASVTPRMHRSVGGDGDAVELRCGSRNDAPSSSAASTPVASDWLRPAELASAVQWDVTCPFPLTAAAATAAANDGKTIHAPRQMFDAYRPRPKLEIHAASPREQVTPFQ